MRRAASKVMVMIIENSPTRAMQIRPRRSRLLVVDHSPTLRTHLEQDGHEVVAVSTGREVLAVIGVQAFDCVIVDLVMPEMSGTALCAHLDRLRRKRGQLFQILILIARDSKKDVVRGLEAGADDVVSKAGDDKILRTRVRALLRRKSLHEETLRITNEARDSELELARSRDEQRSAETRAALAGALERSNHDLGSAYRELQETKTQLVHSAKMASLGELVAGIAHEINNPLAFVASHLTTVSRELERIMPEIEGQLSAGTGRSLAKIRERLGAMHLGVDRVASLIFKLRTFSRLDENEIKSIAIEESIEGVLTLMQHRLTERLTVIKRYGDPKIVSCYPGPLSQVILNLLVNAIDAIDAIDGEGRITIETGRSGTMFFISIADTGCGIPTAIRDQVLEPFFTTKPVGAGTGLGLSISLGIVQRHGGELLIRSREGEGTEVTIRIPLDFEGAAHG